MSHSWVSWIHSRGKKGDDDGLEWDTAAEAKNTNNSRWRLHESNKGNTDPDISDTFRRRSSSSSSSQGNILFFFPDGSSAAAANDKYYQPCPSPTSTSNLPQYNLGEVNISDATYEEVYGDAYVDKPLKYIYPEGYQAMRPRSLPWKLSIALCLSFTWLTVFIVGHCADRSWKYTNPRENNNNNNIGDDDVLVLATRWCGSRPLYLAWLVTVFLTGLTCAYVCIIGYIKARDFAVANSRSQLPGMTMGRSDYYVFMNDAHFISDHNHSEVSYPNGPILSASQQGHDMLYTPQVGISSYQQAPPTSSSIYDRRSIFQPDGTPKKTIFQSDGTPAFWGTHIYKPTQAAVAITHR